MNWLKENIEIVIGAIIIAAIIILALIYGCAPERDPIPTDPNAAHAMVIVETGRTEAKTAADIAKLNAYVELGCWIGAGVCAFLVGLGIWLKSKAMVIISTLAGLACIGEAILLIAKATHPIIIAWVGLGIILIPVVVLIIVAVLNRKALIQVVMGCEHYKSLPHTDNEAFKGSQCLAQSKTTEKIVDKIRNGDSK
jgi:hypothetical protein